ncbi:MAG: M48 family metallopeptidase [Thermodesulfobacteriota bacterium]
MNDLDIEYRVSPRRKNIALKVTAEGRLVVTMPRGTSRENLAKVLEKHGAWIQRKVAERQEAWGQLKEGEAYLLGEAFRLTVLKGTPGVVTLNGKEVRVPLPEGADLWSRLVAWYAERAFGLLRERVKHFAAIMDLAPGPVELKGWKRRWGECHPDGALKFNWRLILLPPEIIDYVVVHELAHLEVPGHNPRFWGVVAKVLPDYAHRRHWLNRAGAPFLLWRVME